MKPFAPACERNSEPILTALRQIFREVDAVLEIGSGTGQHAVYFAEHLSHLTWIPSDLPEHHAGIRQWVEESGLANIGATLSLDVDDPIWPDLEVNAVFTANTLHIISWPQVIKLFSGVGRMLQPGGRLVVYGPFNYNGAFTSQSNAKFDAWLKTEAPHRGIRDMDDLTRLGNKHGLKLIDDLEMPANNRLLLWKKYKSEDG